MAIMFCECKHAESFHKAGACSGCDCGAFVMKGHETGFFRHDQMRGEFALVAQGDADGLELKLVLLDLDKNIKAVIDLGNQLLEAGRTGSFTVTQFSPGMAGKE